MSHPPGPKVLLAEDSVALAGRIVDWLNELPVEVIGPVYDGLEALKLFEQRRPAAAILDLRLPGMNGRELLTHIRSSGHPCYVIIFSNSLGEPSIEKDLKTLGADHLVDKKEGFTPVLEFLRQVVLPNCQ